MPLNSFMTRLAIFCRLFLRLLIGNWRLTSRSWLQPFPIGRIKRLNLGSISVASGMGQPLYAIALTFVAFSMPCLAADPFTFKPEQLATQLTVGYAVRTIDMNSDGKLDIAIVDSKRVLWLENPKWNEHVIYETPTAKFDNVCFAPLDINRDGRMDLALGADWQFGNSDSGGTIGWLESTADGPWLYHSIAAEPTTHRMNWIDIEGNGKHQLIVAPLKGRGSREPGFDQVGIRLLAFEPGMKPTEETWGQRVLTDKLHVMHNFEVTDLDGDKRKELITASYEGVNWLQVAPSGAVSIKQLGSGQVEKAPKRGCSEIRQGELKEGGIYIATIEPWHGDKVVVYVAPKDWKNQTELWPRFVLDAELAWGHAVACVNLDDDPDQELIIGIRDDRSDNHRRGVRIYDPIDPSSGKWQRYVIDPGAVAVEDLVAGDLDGDGDTDIVAVGRATHNVKLYWNATK
jgi:FG-GAP-like repeat